MVKPDYLTLFILPKMYVRIWSGETVVCFYSIDNKYFQNLNISLLFLGLQKIPNEPQLEFILGKEFYLTYSNQQNKNSGRSLQIMGVLCVLLHFTFINIVLFLKSPYSIGIISSNLY